ncbi:RHS repeat domain-containing protein [Jeongeupia naejangsanensis]|uniref:RHS domain-containing protein n=1 Tax=Jeongeupia naejangsanensis TaxID=613195 RepID=A0ABS2BMM9_9NEIS|nr:RHS repeat-associated core domain-containing protein [Jeongeupia naejangsanensis]MBM3116318.1 RHS domain-containing protein [Jeongeupia naejangsanensis]
MKNIARLNVLPVVALGLTLLAPVTASAVATVLDTNYRYDGNNNVTQIQDTVYPELNRTLTYDEIDSLIVANGPWGRGEIYYDGNNNIQRQKYGDWLIDYNYDAQQRLTGVQGAKTYAMQYDGWGNMTTRGDGVSFQYDAAGNLRYANKGAPSQIAYSYDGAGQRVLSVGNNLNRVEFTDQAGQLVYEQDLSTGTTREYIYLGRNKAADIETRSGAETVTYYHTDVLGSPVAATDANGNILWRTYYRPYGERMVGGDGGKNKQWFTGKPYEDQIGLSYFGARWYDPVLGRFAAIDPVPWVEGNPLYSFNSYAYASNNPFKYIDPDGREAESTAASVLGPHTGWTGVDPKAQCTACVASGPWARQMQQVWTLEADPTLAFGLVGNIGPFTKALDDLTADAVKQILKDDMTETVQKAVSLPAIVRYGKELLRGKKAPAITKDGNVIVDGNHRYIAGKVVGKMPDVKPGTVPPGKVGQIQPISNMKIDPTDWGNH